MICNAYRAHQTILSISWSGTVNVRRRWQSTVIFFSVIENLNGDGETTSEETFRFNENIRGQIENIDQCCHGRYAVDHQGLRTRQVSSSLRLVRRSLALLQNRVRCISI